MPGLTSYDPLRYVPQRRATAQGIGQIFGGLAGTARGIGAGVQLAQNSRANEESISEFDRQIGIIEQQAFGGSNPVAEDVRRRLNSLDKGQDPNTFLSQAAEVVKPLNEAARSIKLSQFQQRASQEGITPRELRSDYATLSPDVQEVAQPSFGAAEKMALDRQQQIQAQREKAALTGLGTQREGYKALQERGIDTPTKSTAGYLSTLPKTQEDVEKAAVDLQKTHAELKDKTSGDPNKDWLTMQRLLTSNQGLLNRTEGLKKALGKALEQLNSGQALSQAIMTQLQESGFAGDITNPQSIQDAFDQASQDALNLRIRQKGYEKTTKELEEQAISGLAATAGRGMKEAELEDEVKRAQDSIKSFYTREGERIAVLPENERNQIISDVLTQQGYSQQAINRLLGGACTTMISGPQLAPADRSRVEQKAHQLISQQRPDLIRGTQEYNDVLDNVVNQILQQVQ